MKKLHGFARLTDDERKAMARIGGLAAHAKGRAWEWTKAEAIEAGRKGGLETGRRKRAREQQAAAETGPTNA